MAILDEAVAKVDGNLRVVWTGEPIGEVTAIVEHRGTGRRYTWPELKAWRDPLPGELPRPPKPLRGQLSLF